MTGLSLFNAKNRCCKEATEYPQLSVSDDVAKDIENIAFGVFSPLEGFLCKNDYDKVLHEKRLSNDLPWTIPIILDASPQEVNSDTFTITDPQKMPIALLNVEEVYKLDKRDHALNVYGTTDPTHPGVAKTMAMKDSLVGGKITLLQPSPDEFERYRLKPMETRILFNEKHWRTIVGFQTRNIPHLGHEYVQKTALTFVDGLFINPVIGKKKIGDFKDEVILEAYEVLIRNYYLKDLAVMSILRTEMRYAGPTRSNLPRHNPQKLRMYPLHSGEGPRGSWKILPALRSTGNLQRIPRPRNHPALLQIILLLQKVRCNR